jgi:hypothetical protein
MNASKVTTPADRWRLGLHVKNPGPISLPSWSVFDQAKALSFLLSSFSFLLFYNSQQSCLVLS